MRPEAKQLEGREGLTLEFFSDRGFTPRGVTVIDFVCDPDSSGLEGLKRTGHNPDWVGKGDDQNDTQRQTPSLRLLDWTQDKNRRRLHLEWRTRLVCGSHISTISRGLVGDAFMRLGEQIRFGL